jgi:hypothetical protein
VLRNPSPQNQKDAKHVSGRKQLHAVSELNFTLVPIAQNSKIGFSGSRSNAFDTWSFCTYQAAAALLHKSRLDSRPPSSSCILELAFFPFLLIAS